MVASSSYSPSFEAATDWKGPSVTSSLCALKSSYWDPDVEVDQTDSGEDEFLLISENKQKDEFEELCATSQREILKDYQDCVRRLDRLLDQKAPVEEKRQTQKKSECEEYLGLWKSQVISCYKL